MGVDERRSMVGAGEVQEEAIDFGRLHRPSGGTTCPGVVLIHDVWGPSPHSWTLGRTIAAAGFATLEIDLYRAFPDPRVVDAGERIRSLDDRAVLADLDAAADWLARQPFCAGRRVGVMGVCMGGTYSLLAACRSRRFSAAAPFYGVLAYDAGMFLGPDGRDRVKKPVSPIEAAPDLAMPLLAAFGCDDGFVPEADVERLEAGLARSGKPFRVDRYAGAEHAFLNETRPDAHRPEAAALALARAVDFLRERLA